MANKPYNEYMKDYYHKNKKHILEQTKAYRKLKQKRYYEENREAILKKQSEAAKRRRFEKLQKEILQQSS